VASAAWGIDAAWEGYFDDAPGFVVVRAERVVSARDDVLRVEHVNVRGGVDPRFYVRSLDLLRLVDGRLVPVFQCATHESWVSGPARAGVDTTRAVQYRGPWPYQIDVAARRDHVPGALASDDEVAADRRERGVPSPDEPARAATFVWDGRRFGAARDADLCGAANPGIGPLDALE
jgi:hypothetical protein